MVLIARIFVVIFAYLVACIEGATVVMFAFLTLGQTDFARLATDPAAILVVIGLSSVTLSGYALLPSMLIVALAEGFQLRSAFFYALAGGAVAFVLTFGPVFGINISQIFVRDRAIMVGAGILAGFIYWAIAGRNAGAWRKAHLPLNPRVRT
jgi:dolichyl-phosphate-mannose--protein O-mannosyl transferase